MLELSPELLISFSLPLPQHTSSTLSTSPGVIVLSGGIFERLNQQGVVTKFLALRKGHDMLCYDRSKLTTALSLSPFCSINIRIDCGSTGSQCAPRAERKLGISKIQTDVSTVPTTVRFYQLYKHFSKIVRDPSFRERTLPTCFVLCHPFE